MSRTTKGLKNSKVAMAFYVIDMLLGFFSRKAFIDYVGAEVLGLNTTATNLLQFLNLAELGISSAVAFTLYGPLSRKAHDEVKEIIQVQGWLYRRVATIVIIGAALLMCFFPLIFAKSDLPLWYSYASFGVLLYTSLLTYFFNYRQIALTASQLDYKVSLSYKSVMVAKSLVQILAITYLENGYEWWLIIQVVFGTLATLNLNRCINREFPYLRNLSTNISKDLRRKHSIIITKIKQLFVHRFACFILNQTSPLIIYGYASLTAVAMYGNYMLIVLGISSMLQAVFNGVSAGVGDLIASGDRNRIWAVFKELFTSRFLICTTGCFCLFQLSNSFISLWVGSDMLLPRSTVLVIVVLAYISVFRTVVDNFIFGFGIFADIWAPIAESILNISLSITLGYFFGITGILSGVLISQLLIVVIWKPIYLFTRGLKRPLRQYVGLYLLHIAIFAVSALTVAFVMPMIEMEPTNLLRWAFNALLTFVMFVAIESILLWLFVPSMRAFVSRISSLIHPLKRVLG
jgi:hypothetical protein